jgi:hypothetical protein
MQERSLNSGVAVNVGETHREAPPELDPSASGVEPVDILARIWARVFYRIPGLARLEKHLEGKDSSSGLGSDLLALAVQLYRRNIPLIQAAVEQAVMVKVAEAMEKNSEGAVPPSEPVPGAVQPDAPVDPNNNNGGGI